MKSGRDDWLEPGIIVGPFGPCGPLGPSLLAAGGSKFALVSFFSDSYMIKTVFITVEEIVTQS
jgi:hypothetical protein